MEARAAYKKAMEAGPDRNAKRRIHAALKNWSKSCVLSVAFL